MVIEKICCESSRLKIQQSWCEKQSRLSGSQFPWCCYSFLEVMLNQTLIQMATLKQNVQTWLMVWAVLFLIPDYVNAQKKASEDDDKLAKEMVAPADKALVYVYRPSSAGFAVRMEVTCDGQSLGSTKGKRYIYALLDPGKHSIKSKAENTATLDVDLEGGKTYYILQKVKMGTLMARTQLELVADEGEARKKLNGCKLSGDTEED